MSSSSLKPPATLAIGAITATAVIAMAALSAVLAVIAARDSCSGVGVEAAPSANAKRGIPARYLSLYRQAAREAGVPWPALAAIGGLESDHGRSRAPGVRSGVNRHGCCAGPMQFNTRDGPPSTWERYGLDGNMDGTEDVYDPGDAIPSAASYLRALLRAADGNLSQALFGYNHSHAYVSDVLARARAYARLTAQELAAAAEVDVTTGCSDTGERPAGPANLRAAQRVSSPRAFRTLPSWALAGGEPGAVDARLYDDIIWILRRYHLRVSAAREAGHNTHGDGTAVDLIPADGPTQAVWDAAAGRLAHDLGWTPACSSSSANRPSLIVCSTRRSIIDGLGPLPHVKRPELAGLGLDRRMRRHRLRVDDEPAVDRRCVDLARNFGSLECRSQLARSVRRDVAGYRRSCATTSTTAWSAVRAGGRVARGPLRWRARAAGLARAHTGPGRVELGPSLVAPHVRQHAGRRRRRALHRDLGRNGALGRPAVRH